VAQSKTLVGKILIAVLCVLIVIAVNRVASALPFQIAIVVKVLLWCVLGYVGGTIAARKGYPPRLGVLVGIIFGPITLCVCQLLPATKKGREHAEIERELHADSAERLNCANCGREVSARAPACPRCDHRFA